MRRYFHTHVIGLLSANFTNICSFYIYVRARYLSFLGPRQTSDRKSLLPDHRRRGVGMLVRAWRWYQRCLALHPVKTQVISSGILWGIGDVAAQSITRSFTPPPADKVASFFLFLMLFSFFFPLFPMFGNGCGYLGWKVGFFVLHDSLCRFRISSLGNI